MQPGSNGENVQFNGSSAQLPQGGQTQVGLTSSPTFAPGSSANSTGPANADADTGTYTQQNAAREQSQPNTSTPVPPVPLINMPLLLS